MTHTVPSATSAGAAAEARGPHTDRGPSHVGTEGAANTSRERIRTIVVDDHDDIARLVADRIEAVIAAARAAGRRAVLGLATGSTPIGVYRE
jgi:glucosamine-6-phosphate deaminase